jgi:hypothetical protein
MSTLGKPGDHEAPTAMPFIISPEAWEAAMEIETSVAQFLSDIGLKRINEQAGSIAVMAKMVQFAINKSHAARDKA